MRTARRLALLLLLGWAAAGSSARAYLPPPYGGTVAAPLTEQPVTLDPARASRESELQVISLLYDPLFALGPDGRPRPHLAHAPEISPDGRTWRMTLRAGVLASGRPVNAAEAAASLRRLKRGPNGYLMAPVHAIEVEGDVTWLVNRNAAGWMVTLLNPAGQAKPQHGITPTDFRENRLVTVISHVPVQTAVDKLLPTDRLEVRDGRVTFEVPAGAVRIIELR